MKTSTAMSTGPDVLIVYMIVWQKERDEKKKKKTILGLEFWINFLIPCCVDE